MKKNIIILLCAGSSAFAATQPVYSIDNSNNTASSTHSFEAVDSANINIALKLDGQKFVNIGYDSTLLFNVGNGSESITIGSQFDLYYPGVNTGLLKGSDVDYNSLCLQLYTDSGRLTEVAYVTLMFTYQKDGLKQGYDGLGYYLAAWDKDGNLMEDIVSGLDGMSWNPVSYNIDNFTMLNINTDLIISANVYDAEFDSKEGMKIFNQMVNNIPEPTTATLSLLALAGLAARRRRA